MKIPPQNFYCLIWSYRFNFYKARGWRDGTAGYFAGVNAFGVYGFMILGLFFVSLGILTYAGIKPDLGFFIFIPALVFLAYYTNYKDKNCHAVFQSMEPPRASVYFSLLPYGLGTLVVPFICSLAMRSAFFISMLISSLCIALSVSIADHWAAGKIRQLQAARAAELHGKHAPR